tara:strand:- start:507 stop:1403 length:897 start_codon:yes stop_codon:yes gene_type:complete
MNNLDNLTLVILTYKTGKEILDNCLSSIDKNIKIIVVENSTYFENQKYFEDKYKNIKIILTEKNLGYAGGNNFGLNMVKTEYALIFNPDIICEKNFFSSIQKYLDGKLDFSIIGTSFAEQSDYHTAGFFDNKKNLKEANFLNEFNLYDVDWVSGCSLLLNLNNFDDKKIFDENFFLFFEENDLCFRVKSKGGKIFMSTDLKITHLGFKSSLASLEKYKFEFSKLRNWHYMWSFYYYHKKNYGMITALKKSTSRLLRYFMKFIFYSLMFDKKNKILYFCRFSGLINSICNKKSSFRIKI